MRQRRSRGGIASRAALGVLILAAVALTGCEDVAINWTPERPPPLRPAGEELRRVHTRPASSPASEQ